MSLPLKGKYAASLMGVRAQNPQWLEGPHTEKISPEHHNEITGATRPMGPDLPQPPRGCPWKPLGPGALSLEEAGNGALEAPSDFLHVAPEDEECVS